MSGMADSYVNVSNHPFLFFFPNKTKVLERVLFGAFFFFFSMDFICQGLHIRMLCTLTYANTAILVWK